MGRTSTTGRDELQLALSRTGKQLTQADLQYRVEIGDGRGNWTLNAVGTELDAVDQIATPLAQRTGKPVRVTLAGVEQFVINRSAL